MSSMRLQCLSAPLAALLLAACAASGPFPSLAMRDVEREFAIEAPPSPVPLIPSDPATAARIGQLVGAGQAGDADFQQALAAAQPLATRAGAAGSESWVVAEQAASRVQAARSRTVDALADLDAIAIRLAAARPAASQTDIAAAVAAAQTIQALSDRQQEALDALRARLSGG
jgi:hypothetical protein